MERILFLLNFLKKHGKILKMKSEKLSKSILEPIVESD